MAFPEDTFSDGRIGIQVPSSSLEAGVRIVPIAINGTRR
jgi:hypothetical protein